MSKRKRLIRRALILWLLSLMVVSPALAHSGSLDSNGGHWNHSTGTYHYHSGEHTEGSSGGSSGYSYSTGSYYVTTGSVNLREGPSTDYRIIATLNPGVRVKYISSTQGWYRVNYNGQIGYVSGNYLKPTSAPVSYNKSVVSKSAVKAAATPTAKPVPTTAPTAKPSGKRTGNIAGTILCILFFGLNALICLFIFGSLAFALFQGIVELVKKYIENK